MEGVFSIPKHLFQRHFGITIDFGSSAIKVIHTSEDGDNLKLHCAKFMKDGFEEALALMKDVCAGKLVDSTTIYTTGMGIATHKVTLEKALSVKIENMSELYCIVDGFQLLARALPWNQFVFDNPEEIRQEAANLARGYEGLHRSHATDDRLRLWRYMECGVDSQLHIENIQQVQYPALVVHIGSCMSPFLIEADGKFTFCAVSPICGKTFQGLGNLLTGAQDVHKLYKLAEEGDKSNIHQLYSNTGTSSDDKCYKENNNVHLTIKSFAHAADKSAKQEDFSSADRMAAVLSMVTQHIATESHFWAAHYNVKQVFFTGGFPTLGENVRHMIGLEFMYRNTTSLNHCSDYKFVKNSAFICAFGSLFKMLNEPVSELQDNSH